MAGKKTLDRCSVKTHSFEGAEYDKLSKYCRKNGKNVSAILRSLVHEFLIKKGLL